MNDIIFMHYLPVFFQLSHGSESSLMKIKDILRVKGSHVFTISEEATLQDVVTELVANRVGALVVVSKGKEKRVVGVITERDILRACVIGSRPLSEVRVAEVMSAPPITGTPEDDIESVMSLMTFRRIRHLPVLEEEKLVGLISIGDLVKAQLDRLALENRYLKDYLSG